MYGYLGSRGGSLGRLRQRRGGPRLILRYEDEYFTSEGWLVTIKIGDKMMADRTKYHSLVQRRKGNYYVGEEMRREGRAGSRPAEGHKPSFCQPMFCCDNFPAWVKDSTLADWAIVTTSVA